jgi:hypothetical protein
MPQSYTPRGFAIYADFTQQDYQGSPEQAFTVQESSLATERKVWIGSGSERAHLNEAEARRVRDALTEFLGDGDVAESHPSLTVQSEEALAEWLSAALVSSPDYLARALIESGVVRVAPSLMAASRKATIEHLVTIENDHWYDISESRNLGYYRTEITCACGAVLWWGDHDGDPHRAEVWNGHLADALLAPGGPVQVADATPEQAWAHVVRLIETHITRAPLGGVYARLFENPYVGNSRKEQSNGE